MIDENNAQEKSNNQDEKNTPEYISLNTISVWCVLSIFALFAILRSAHTPLISVNFKNIIHTTEMGVVMDLTVIYPAYNEEENIKRIPRELLYYLDKLHMSYEVLVIDDGSKDHTAAETKKLIKKYPQIMLVQHAKNQGLGMAVRTGIKHARGIYTVTIDGDFTFHPRQIKNLFTVLKKSRVDCVIGSPTLLGYEKDVPFYRIFLSKGVNVLYMILLGKKITAVSPIFRLYKTKQLKELNLHTTSFDINAEILFKLLQNHRTIIEIPAKLTTRRYGVSKLNNIREIKNHLKLLWRMLLWKMDLNV
jgi:dolichol-phosphate mannosyltransferase